MIYLKSVIFFDVARFVVLPFLLIVNDPLNNGNPLGLKHKQLYPRIALFCDQL